MFNLFGKKRAKRRPVFSIEPDGPYSFGYKTSWVAVRSEPADLASALDLQDPVPANWETGGNAALNYMSRMSRPNKFPRPLIFVTPRLGEWCMAMSLHLPAPDEALTDEQFRHEAPPGPRGAKFLAMMETLSARFDEVQYFGSYRVVSYAGWARAKGGRVVRAFSFGEGVKANFGARTPEEKALGLLDLTGLSLDQAEEKIFEDEEADRLPDESWVVRLAAAWSIDPTTLNEAGYPKAVGIVGSLSDRFWSDPNKE